MTYRGGKLAGSELEMAGRAAGTHTEPLNKALREQCATLRALLAKASTDEIRTRYRIGVIILRVQNSPETFGAKGVERLAAALTCDRTTLYRHGQVARTFDRRTVERVLSASKRSGGSLAWSHLLVLMSVRDENERARLLELALNGASVRELEQAARPTTNAAPTSPNGLLRFLLTTTESLKGRAGAEVDFDLLASASDQESLQLVEKLVASLEELGELCARNAKQFRDLRTQVADRLQHDGRRASGVMRAVRVTPLSISGGGGS